MPVLRCCIRQFSSIFRSRLPHPKLDPLERGGGVDPEDSEVEADVGFGEPLLTVGVNADSMAEIFCEETFYDRPNSDD